MPSKAKQLSSRTALLIHCSRSEAKQIRDGARKERRTISGFVLNAVLSRFEIEERLEERRQSYREAMAAAKRANLVKEQSHEQMEAEPQS
jgi:uncharacterized protein (DUF1778 family)